MLATCTELAVKSTAALMVTLVGSPVVVMLPTVLSAPVDVIVRSVKPAPFTAIAPVPTVPLDIDKAPAVAAATYVAVIAPFVVTSLPRCSIVVPAATFVNVSASDERSDVISCSPVTSEVLKVSV